MKTRNQLSVVANTALMILLLLSLYPILKDIVKDKDKPILNNYGTDTIYLQKPYLVPSPYPIPVKPNIITYFKDNPTDAKLKRINDSLQAVISKRDTVYVKDKFLTLFPYNPKLLSLDLKKDSLHFTLLGIDALTTQYSYPVYLNDFTYRWDEKYKLTAKPIKHTEDYNRYRFNAQLNAFGGYEILQGIPEIGIEARSNLSSFFIGAETSTTIQNKPELSIKGKVGFRLNQWPRK